VRLRATAPGYLETVVEVPTGGAPLTVLLKEAPRVSEEVQVSAGVTLSAAAAPTLEITPEIVRSVAGSADNVFRVLQTLPGVSATNDIDSRLSVRGGGPDQNLTVMDGVEIHNPYRLFGLTSAFNPETIARFEFATGGFSAKYGDRLSSMLLIENRAGTRTERLAGSASLSITDANVVLEGALPGRATGSWLVTGRRTYYDLVAERIADQQFPAFADLQAKTVWDVGPGRSLTLFGLRSRQDAAISIDEDEARGEFQDDTRNDLASVRFDTSIGTRGRAFTVAAYSRSRTTAGVDASFENSSRRSNTPAGNSFGVANVVFERTLAVEDTSLRQEAAWAIGAHVLEAGGDVHRLSTRLRFAIDGDRNPVAANGSSVQGGAGLPDLLDSPRTSTRGAAWLVDTWQLHRRLSVQSGLRLDLSGVNREALVSPRLSASMDVTARQAEMGPDSSVVGWVEGRQSVGAKAIRFQRALQGLMQGRVEGLRRGQTTGGDIVEEDRPPIAERSQEGGEIGRVPD
jgi:outer membrane receptor for ferrienterochelin and colicin